MPKGAVGPLGSGSISPDQRSRTRIPLGDGSGVTTCPGEGSTQPKQPGAPDLPRGPVPHIYIRTPQQGGNRHPAWGGPEPPRVSRRRYACVCQASSGRLAYLRHSMRETLRALCHSRARGDFRQAVLLVARYQGAQYSRWRRSCHARRSATPVRHDNSATEYHNAYAVDPTVYAATYTASTGTSPMGQVKTPLGQRVYRAMKCIQKEIHNALLMSF